MPLVCLNAKMSGKSHDQENPFKNVIILTYMMEHAFAHGGIDTLMMGSHTKDTITDLDRNSIGDSREFLAECSVSFKNLCGVSVRNDLLKSDFHAWEVVAAKRPDLIDVVSSCITPPYRRGRLLRLSRDRFNSPLTEGSCGSCYKCATKYLILLSIGHYEPCAYAAKAGEVLANYTTRYAGEGKYEVEQTIKEWFGEGQMEDCGGDYGKITEAVFGSRHEDITAENDPDKEGTVSSLRLNPRNPRRISNERLELLKQSLVEFGDLSGVVRNLTTGNLVGGHQRVKAFRMLNDEAKVIIEKIFDEPTENGTVALGYIQLGDERFTYREVKWDEQKESAGMLIANKLAGEFVASDVGELLKGITSDHLLMLTGFEVGEISDLLQGTQSVADKLDSEATPAFTLDEIKEDAVKNFKPLSLDEMVKYLMTSTRAKVEFNRLCSGYEDGYWISILFNPHRLLCRTKTSKWNIITAQESNMGWRKVWARWMQAYPEKGHWLKQIGMGWGGVSVANEFAPYVARDIARFYLQDKGRPWAKVIDPCHGWGGRLIGLMASGRVKQYDGFDPANETHDGPKRLHQFLNEGAVKMDADIVCCPFEDANVRENHYDFAVTSPPYFDTEHYPGDRQSRIVFNSFSEWVEGFYFPMLDKTMRSLKKGATFLLNVGNNKYPLGTKAKDWAKEKGFNCKPVKGNWSNIGGHGLGGRGENAAVEGENFYELKKP